MRKMHGELFKKENIMYVIISKRNNRIERVMNKDKQLDAFRSVDFAPLIFASIEDAELEIEGLENESMSESSYGYMTLTQFAESFS